MNRASLSMLLLVTSPAGLVAQRTINDRVAIELVAGAIAEKASHLIVRAALDTAAIPFELILPAEATSPAWRAFRAHFTRVVGGRAVLESDRRRHVVEISAVEITADTMTAWIDVGVRTRCHEGWVGDGNAYTVKWIRRGDRFWHGPRRDEQIAYDSFGCPVEGARDPGG